MHTLERCASCLGRQSDSSIPTPSPTARNPCAACNSSSGAGACQLGAPTSKGMHPCWKVAAASMSIFRLCIHSLLHGQVDATGGTATKRLHSFTIGGSCASDVFHIYIMQYAAVVGHDMLEGVQGAGSVKALDISASRDITSFKTARAVLQPRETA